MFDTHNQITSKNTQQGQALFWLVIVIVLLAIGAWYFYLQPNQKNDDEPLPPMVEEPLPPAPLPAIEAAPDIPQAPPQVSDGAESQPLPSLETSDAYTREQLLAITPSEEFALWAQTDNLLQKTAAVIDGLARGVLLRKVIPLEPPGEKFQVIAEDGELWLDESNFARFDPMVSTLTSIEPAQLAALFQRLRPLLEQALGQLGVAPDSLDNRLIAAIDLILATPDQSGPIALKRESVNYQFKDPALENLPAIQKQMIRLGPANSSTLKQYLKKVRSALLAQPEPNVVQEQ